MGQQVAHENYYNQTKARSEVRNMSARILGRFSGHGLMLVLLLVGSVMFLSQSTVCQPPGAAWPGAPDQFLLESDQLRCIPYKCLHQNKFPVLFTKNQEYVLVNTSDECVEVWRFDYTPGNLLKNLLFRKQWDVETLTPKVQKLQKQFKCYGRPPPLIEPSAVFPISAGGGEFLILTPRRHISLIYRWKPPHSLQALGDTLEVLAFPRVSGDGRYLAAVRYREPDSWQIEVWDLENLSRRFMRDVKRSTSRNFYVDVAQVAISASGNRVAFFLVLILPSDAGWQETLWVWEVNTGNLVFQETKRETGAKNICECRLGREFAGSWLAFVGEHGQGIIFRTGNRYRCGMRYVDLETKQTVWDVRATCLRSGLPSQGLTHPIAVSDDGRWLATGGVLWDLYDATPIGIFGRFNSYDDDEAWAWGFVPGHSRLFCQVNRICDLFCAGRDGEHKGNLEYLEASMSDLWRQFTSSDRYVAFLALQAFLSRPKETPRFLKTRLETFLDTPAVGLSVEEIIKQLDSPDFAQRESIHNHLVNCGIKALPVLKELERQKESIPAETGRRLKDIRSRVMLSASTVRWALACLEYLGDAESEAALRWAAENLSEPSLRAEATASLERLNRKKIRR